MALAILKQSESGGGKLAFQLGLGGNRYYRLLVGGPETVNEQGMARMERVARQTQVIGPTPEHPSGQLEIAVPRRWFDRQNRHLQLVSYSNAQGHGAAWSDLVPVMGFQDDSGDALVPLGVRGMSVDGYSSRSTQAMSLPAAQSSAFAYKEVTLSKANSFLDILKGLLPGLLTGAKDAVSKAADKNPNASPVLSSLQQLLGSPQIMDILQAILGAAKPGVATAQSMSYSVHSRAMTIPPGLLDALLKAVPALAPVLQSAVQGVTNPQFIDAIGRNSPVTKILDSSTGIIRDALGLNLDLNTNVEDMTKFGTDINALVAQMLNAPSAFAGSKSLSLPGRARAFSAASVPAADLQKAGISFLPVPHVLLSFGYEAGGEGRADLASLHFAGGQPIAVPLHLNTPKPISKALLVLRVIRLDGVVMAEQRHQLSNLQAGVLPVLPRFEASVLAGLEPGQEHTLSVRLLWPGKNQQRLGTAVSRIVSFLPQLSYDRVLEADGPLLPLNDLDRHRAAWHKVWGAGLTEDFRDIDLDCKYFVTLRRDMQPSARLETLTEFQESDGDQKTGRLKSGMEWGLEALNALLPILDKGAPLSLEELRALDTPQFAHRFTQVARIKVDFWGLAGESVALWVYPEVRMTRIALKAIAGVNAHGQVTAMQERTISLPIPEKIHFIGAKI
jgi:hypothetical protein